MEIEVGQRISKVTGYCETEFIKFEPYGMGLPCRLGSTTSIVLDVH